MARTPKRTVANSEVTEAIDLAGPALFGADWIDRLTDEDRDFLAKHDHASLFIGQYPPDIADRLSRLIGQDFRMGVQRATVLRWLFEKEVISNDLKCAAGALNAAIAGEQAKRKSRNEGGAPGNKPGRPRNVSERVVFEMLGHLRSGFDLIGTGEFLKKRYGASINTCFEARKVALAEWDRLCGNGFSKIPNK